MTTTLINKSYVKSHIECTGISNCKLFDDANLCTSSWRASLLTSILVATFERAERYTTTHATSVANSSSLNSTSKYYFKLGYKFSKKLNKIISRNENYSPDQREERWEMVILSHTRYKDGAIRQQLAREFYPIKEGKKN